MHEVPQSGADGRLTQIASDATGDKDVKHNQTTQVRYGRWECAVALGQDLLRYPRDSNA